MELVYLWVEDYKNIHKQGFNFSPRFECVFHDKYEEDENGKKKLKDDCELEIIEKEYESVFPENINLTAIVGENGSGKSSILVLLKFILFKSECSSFIVYLTKEKKLKYYGGLKVVSKAKKVDNLSVNVLSESSDILNIYLSANNNLSLYDVDNDQLYNMLKSQDHRQDYYIPIELDLYKHKTYYQSIILNYLLTNKKENNIFNPDQLIIHIDNKYFIRKLSAIFSYISKEPYAKIKINIEEALKSFKNDRHRYLLYYYLKNVNDNSNLQETILNESCLIEKTLPSLEKLENFCERDKDIIDLVEECFQKKKQKNLKNKNFQKKIAKIFENQILKNLLLDLFSLNLFDSKIQKSYDQLSSGEQSFLSIIATIYIELRKKNRESIFLLDELDTFLHPEWQKSYLKELMDLVSLFTENKVHFLITSHSPFLLSDLPKENVIFLEKGKQVDVDIETFGANIHTLLSHGFFMKGGLIGEFAKGNINDAIARLNQTKLSEDDIKFCENIIKITGEPIIKRQMQKMLDSKRLSKIDELEVEMELMKHRIEILRKNQ